MHVTRLQPPLALVSALCIAAVPLQGAPAIHALDAASVAVSESGRTVSTWSLPYTLDANAVALPGLPFTTWAINTAEARLNKGFTDLVLNTWSCLTSFNLCAVRYFVQGAAEIALSALFGGIGIPAAFVVDVAFAVFKAILPSAAAIPTGAATKHASRVTPAATAIVTALPKPEATTLTLNTGSTPADQGVAKAGSDASAQADQGLASASAATDLTNGNKVEQTKAATSRRSTGSGERAGTAIKGVNAVKNVGDGMKNALNPKKKAAAAGNR